MMKFLFALLVIVAASEARTRKFRLPYNLAIQKKFWNPPNERIVGGEDATRGQFPYIVSFQDKVVGNFHFCAGSIYNENTVITACHCVDGQNAAELRIVSGKLTYDDDSGNGEQARDISEIIEADYNSFNFENDGALLILESALEFDANTQPVLMPLPLTEPDNQMLTCAGWGATVQGGSHPDVLQHVQVPFVTDDKCNEGYGGDVLESMICAGDFDNGGIDSCQGDSGGPLVDHYGTLDDPSDDVLVGIVSWGYGCAQATYPGVYTQVSYFVSFITQNAKY